MSEKKQFGKRIACLAGGFLACALLFGGMVIMVDPWYQYHAPWFDIPVVLENAVYQAAGTARNLEYDSAIVGTSMTENFRTSWFDEELGWDTMKLSYSGARSNDLRAVFEQIFRREEPVKNVVLDINDYQLTSDSWTQYVTRPEYLYDTVLLNDYKYLYNHDVYVQCVNRCIDKCAGVEDNIDSAYVWGDKEVFGTERARAESRDLRNQTLWGKAARVNHEELYLVEGCISDDFPDQLVTCQENLDNIIPFIEKNPNTDFYVLLPPYSMLYWEQKVLEDELEEMLSLYVYAVEKFLQYENVKIYYFQCEEDIISNLDNYRDSTHYKMEYNRYMFECIRDDKNRITLENYKEAFEEMYHYAKDFSYVSLWED